MHEHHRKRMRERYSRSGADGFATHELLEILLFYSIPRADTNEIAHALLERFGSLRGILSASEDELQEVAGIGPKSAMLLRLITEFMRRCAEDGAAPVVRYDTVSKIAEFFCRRFIGVANEQLYMMLLNNRMNLIDCVLISEGTVNGSAVSIRKMTEQALRKNASAVVLAHNHPNGIPIPSSNDLEITEQIRSSLDVMEIVLVEHLIITDDRYCPIMRQKYADYRRSPGAKRVDSGFYQHFYDVSEEDWRAQPLFGESGIK